MTTKASSVPYSPLPSNPPPQNVVVLTYFRPPPDPSLRLLRRCLLFASSSPRPSSSSTLPIRLSRSPGSDSTTSESTRTGSSRSTSPSLCSSSSGTATSSRWTTSLSLCRLDIEGGRELGVVRSRGGRVRARGSSFVNATLDLDGLEVVYDVFCLIEDLARAVVPFDTASKVKGELGLLVFKVPIEGKVSCEVYVNTANETIVRENCYS